MSIVKDVIMETVRRMPENVTFEDAAYQILDIGSVLKDLKFSEADFIKFHRPSLAKHNIEKLKRIGGPRTNSYIPRF